MGMLRTFLADDGGAVTIDWVALTSGILLLGIAVIYAIFNSGVASAVGEINGAMGSLAVIDPGAAPDLSGSSGATLVANDYVTDTARYHGTREGPGALTYTDENGQEAVIENVTPHQTGDNTYTYTNSDGNVVLVETQGSDGNNQHTVVGEPYPYNPPT